jgi:hypothetical protein
MNSFIYIPRRSVRASIVEGVYLGIVAFQAAVSGLAQDTQVDSNFVPGTGPDRPVYAVAEASDRKIVIGGMFSSVNGSTRHYVARLSRTGAVDASSTRGWVPISWCKQWLRMPMELSPSEGLFSITTMLPFTIRHDWIRTAI